MKKVALILGSGGARGMAHVGVIRWLEEKGFEIVGVSGCSSGALIGGSYATGRLEALVEFVKEFKKKDVFNMLDFVFSKDGLVKGSKVMETLEEYVGSENIEDLNIKYTAVAADIEHEQEVWLDSGPICEAVRASISLPLFFKPHSVNGKQLIDGGILNPTPIEPALQMNADLTVAVNLGGSPIKEVEDTPEPKSLFQRKLDEFIENLSFSKNKTQTEWDMLFIADQSFNSMQNMIANQKMAVNPPDFLVNIARNKCGTLEFERSSELIEHGYQMAEEQLQDMLNT